MFEAMSGPVDDCYKLKMAGKSTWDFLSMTPLLKLVRNFICGTSIILNPIILSRGKEQ